MRKSPCESSPRGRLLERGPQHSVFFHRRIGLAVPIGRRKSCRDRSLTNEVKHLVDHPLTLELSNFSGQISFHCLP